MGDVPDAGKDWGQKEKRVPEDEMAGLYHRCDDLGQTPGDGEGQGGLVCCSPWRPKVPTWPGDWTTTTERLFSWSKLIQAGFKFNSPVWLNHSLIAVSRVRLDMLLWQILHSVSCAQLVWQPPWRKAGAALLDSRSPWTHPMGVPATLWGHSLLQQPVHLLSRVRLFATPWTAAPRPPCPSPTPRVHSNSCRLSRWCHLTLPYPLLFPSPPAFNLSQQFCYCRNSTG